MTDILTFNNPEFGSIRTIEQNGEPWFVGKDVAQSLGYGEGKSLANAVAILPDTAQYCLILRGQKKHQQQDPLSDGTPITERGSFSFPF